MMKSLSRLAFAGVLFSQGTVEAQVAGGVSTVGVAVVASTQFTMGS